MRYSASFWKENMQCQIPVVHSVIRKVVLRVEKGVVVYPQLISVGKSC